MEKREIGKLLFKFEIADRNWTVSFHLCLEINFGLNFPTSRFFQLLFATTGIPKISEHRTQMESTFLLLLTGSYHFHHSENFQIFGKKFFIKLIEVNDIHMIVRGFTSKAMSLKLRLSTLSMTQCQLYNL